MSTIERAQVEALAEHLRDIHFDGTGCGTSGTGGCSNCFGPSPMSAHEIAEETLEWATKRPLDLPALVSAQREADRLALAAARAEVERLTGVVEREATLGDRIVDIVEAERDRARANLAAANATIERVRDLVDPIQVRNDLKTGWNMLRAQVRAALDGQVQG